MNSPASCDPVGSSRHAITAPKAAASRGLVAALAFAAGAALGSSALAATCVVTNGVKVGDCSHVDTEPPRPHIVASGSESLAKVYSDVTVRPGATAILSGVAANVRVEPGGRLVLSGVNQGELWVAGEAEITGMGGDLHMAPGGRARVSGVVRGVRGSGVVEAEPGAILGARYAR